MYNFAANGLAKGIIVFMVVGDYKARGQNGNI